VRTQVQARLAVTAPDGTTVADCGERDPPCNTACMRGHTLVFEVCSGEVEPAPQVPGLPL
jgi:hypothetical protein